MKNKKLNIFILFIMIILVLYFTLKEDFSGIVSQLYKTNFMIFIVCIFIFNLSLLFKSLSLQNFLKDYNNNYSLKEAYKLTLISQFLNGITPFQSGGQPFEIYLLKKQNVRITDSTNALLKDFISFQIALIVIGIFSVILNLKLNILSNVSYLNWVIFAGFMINIGVLIFLFIFLCAKKTGKKIGDKIVNFVFNLKFMNRFVKARKRALDGIEHFYNASDSLKKSKYKIFISAIFNLFYLILLYLVPLFVFMSLGYNKISILGSLVATSFVMIIGNFIPIPGATGGIEYSFMQLFGNFATGPILSSAMLLWRAVTYFLAMVIGAFVLLFNKEGKKA